MIEPSRIGQTEEHRWIGRIYRDSKWTDRATARDAPVGAEATTVGLSLNTVTWESGTVPGQGQKPAAFGQSEDWRTQVGAGNDN